MSYTAPIRDMRFVMEELIGFAEISLLRGNEEASADLIEAILEEAGKFVSSVLGPLKRIAAP